MKTKTKRIIQFSIVAVLILWLLSWIFRNALLLGGMVSRLEWAVHTDSKISLVETESIYGKLNGNGNGINFFGAVLVTADNEEALDAFIVPLQDDYEVIGYHQQIGRQVIVDDHLEHGSLVYNTAVPEDDSSAYYTIWFYNSYHKAANLMDLRGH